MNQIVCDYSIVLDSPLGRLGVCLQAGHVTRLNYLPKTWRLRPATTKMEQGVVQQLESYFSDPRSRFKLPLEMHGTPFQLRVWQALQTIPAGTTVTYGQLAERLDSGARAVGNACRRNPDRDHRALPPGHGCLRYRRLFRQIRWSAAGAQAMAAAA